MNNGRKNHNHQTSQHMYNASAVTDTPQPRGPSSSSSSRFVGPVAHTRLTSQSAHHSRSDSHTSSSGIPGLKRKKSSGSVNAATQLVVAEDVDMDGSEKHVVKGGLNATSHTGHHRARREKGKAIDKQQYHHHTISPAVPVSESSRDKDSAEKHTYSGPLAHAEFDRMRKEVETLKKALHDHRKTVKKQAKRMDEMKDELALNSSVKEELEILKAKAAQHEEVVNTIESSLQCQICTDFLYQPHAVSPCGHVFCLECLQVWFRKAPPSNEDMIDGDDPDDDPHYVLNRQKSCPCCRAVATRRPVPVFVLKAVSEAFKKVNPAIRQEPPSSSDSQDPWKGIFYADSDDYDSIDDGEDDDGGDDPLNLGWGIGMGYGGYDYESASGSDDGEVDDDDEDDEDDEDEDVEYVRGTWEPPAYPELMSPEVDARTLNMLQRGCTDEMIRRYSMQYGDTEGLVAFLPRPSARLSERDRMYLGFNIELDEEDPEGEYFVQCLLQEVIDYPHRWEVGVENGVRIMKRLVRLDDPVEYENWLDAEDVDVY